MLTRRQVGNVDEWGTVGFALTDAHMWWEPMTGGERMVFLYLHVSLPLSLSTPVLLLSVLVLLANLSSSFYLFNFCTLNMGSFMYILPCLYLCVCTLLYHTIVFASVYTCVYTTQAWVRPQWRVPNPGRGRRAYPSIFLYQPVNPAFQWWRWWWWWWWWLSNV